MVSKLSKDLFFEIDQVDQQVQRLKKRFETSNSAANENAANNMSNVNGSGVLLGSALDPSIKTELRECRRSIDHLYSQIQNKANIADVCALVDLKAN